MTLRAFAFGLAAVLIVALVDPYTSFNKTYGWNTVGHFPAGAVFFLVFFTIVVNLAIKCVRKGWALRQAELMLIWGMLIVGCAVPSDGLLRWWFPILAGPPYLARGADVSWKDTALKSAPSTLLVTKDPKSVAAKQFFEGRREEGRFPLREWLTPISRWLTFMGFFYLATFFLCGILRKQWMENERLQFPLARVPLEFTEGSAGEGWLPRLFSNRAFIAGLIATAAFRFLRAAPLIIGANRGWGLSFNFKDILQGTPLEQLYLENLDVWWDAVAFAYLVPADVSLSVWFFYLFGRWELQTAAWLGSPLHYGGTYSDMMESQQAGSYVAFVVGALFMARRHLLSVARKAVGIGREVTDAGEPVGYRLAFWGFVTSSVGALGWLVYYGMGVPAAVALFALLVCIMIVHARIVSQSGLYITLPIWTAPNVLHGVLGGGLFSPEGAVVAQMQHGIMMQGNTALLAPAVMHSFRVGEAMERGRRLLVPVLFVTLMIAIAASSATCLYQTYWLGGALNHYDAWGTTGSPRWVFEQVHLKMTQPTQVFPARWVPLGLGAGLTAFVMFMRARFYWWPIHPIGVLGLSSWHMDRLWMPFLLGWVTKVALVKFGSGRLVRQARFFFIALIMVEVFVGGVSMIIVTLTEGRLPGF